MPRRPRSATKVAIPRQERSRASMERVLEATEELLCERPFDDISVHDIVRRARTSVGAFYNRFGEKDALLPYLIERHYDAQRRSSEQLYACDLGAGDGLAQRFRMIIEGAVVSLRERRGLYRAIYLRLITRPQDLSQQERNTHEAIMGQLLEWLGERRGEISHPHPDEALRFAIAQLFATLNILILGDSPGSSSRFTDQDLIEHAHHSMLAFLGLREPERSPKRRAASRRSGGRRA